MSKKLSTTRTTPKKKNGKKSSKTPSQARNDILTCLNEIVDPFTDKDKDAVWAYFDNHCAYCDDFIERKSRNGHMDHLVSKKDNGLNHISNRVLACNICNGDHKRDTAWEDFILTRKGNTKDHACRISKIKDWRMSKAPSEDEEKKLKLLRSKASELSKDVISVLDVKIDELKKLK